MKYYANTWAFLNDDRNEAFRKIAALGFDGVEIIAHGPCWHADTLDTAKEREASLALLKELNLEIVAVSPHTEFLVFDRETRRREVQHAMAMTDMALRYGVRLLRIFAGGAVPEGRTREECIDTVLLGLRPCVEYAESRGVTLAVESHGLFGTDLPALKAVIDGIPSDFLGVTLDTSNFYQSGVDPLDAIAAFGKRIYHTHMKDGMFSPEYLPAALGEGALDFKAIIAALQKAGYRGAYCMEYDGNEPYEALKRGLANLKHIMSEGMAG